MADLLIRPTTIEDAPLILHFIHELAVCEKAEAEVEATEAHIHRTIFCENPLVEALICEHNGEPIGFAVFFHNYSTWTGKLGLFLEDLFISPESRGLGGGKALLKHLAKIAIERDCGRFEWNVLDWNTPAIKFYESLQAKAQSEWIGYRLTGEALQNLANS